MVLSSQPTEGCDSYAPELNCPAAFCFGLRTLLPDIYLDPVCQPRGFILEVVFTTCLCFPPHWHLPGVLIASRATERFPASHSFTRADHTAFFFFFNPVTFNKSLLRSPSDDGGGASSWAFDAVNKPFGAGLSLSFLPPSLCHTGVPTKHQDVV